MLPTPASDELHPFTPYLQPGEELLWIGRPNAKFYSVRRRQRSIRIFKWLTSLSAINTIFVAFHPPFPFLTGVSIFATLYSSAYLVFLLHSAPRLSTYRYPWYAVSNKRVIEYTGLGEDPVGTIPFEHIHGLMITVASDNIGSINFVKGTALTHFICLTDIEEMREVCELIQTSAKRDIPIVEKDGT